ncbi:MAG TPA: HEAT repeat domain-containing protein, partial [Planctomycetota bacterium]
ELRGSVFGRRVDLRRQLVHDVGRFGHPSFWAAIEPFLKDPDRGVRAEAAAAFEQLGAPESVKALRAAFGKEDAADVRKNLVRALGTAGLADRVVRQQLAKSARSEKDPFVRRNALIALAQTADAEVAREVLVEALEGKDADLARAAALGIAYARRGELRDAVAKAQEARGLDDELYARVLAVLDGANLETLLGDFRGVAGDEIVRERFFAPAR